jgi:hypothetical protein
LNRNPTPPVNKKAPDHKTVYSNVVRIGITPFDIKIVFGQVVDQVPGDPAQQTEDLVTVIMSAEEAKAMIPFVQQAVQSYETRFGKIRDVTSLMAKIREEALGGAAMPDKAAMAPKAETRRRSKKS